MSRSSARATAAPPAAARRAPESNSLERRRQHRDGAEEQGAARGIALAQLLGVARRARSAPPAARPPTPARAISTSACERDRRGLVRSLNVTVVSSSVRAPPAASPACPSPLVAAAVAAGRLERPGRRRWWRRRTHGVDLIRFCPPSRQPRGSRRRRIHAIMERLGIRQRPLWPLPAARAARRGRDGRGVPRGARRPARLLAHRGAQAHPARARARRRLLAPLPRRGAHLGAAASSHIVQVYDFGARRRRRTSWRWSTSTGSDSRAAARAAAQAAAPRAARASSCYLVSEVAARSTTRTRSRDDERPRRSRSCIATSRRRTSW